MQVQPGANYVVVSPHAGAQHVVYTPGAGDAFNTNGRATVQHVPAGVQSVYPSAPTLAPMSGNSMMLPPGSVILQGGQLQVPQGFHQLQTADVQELSPVPSFDNRPRAAARMQPSRTESFERRMYSYFDKWQEERDFEKRALQRNAGTSTGELGGPKPSPRDRDLQDVVTGAKKVHRKKQYEKKRRGCCCKVASRCLIALFVLALLLTLTGVFFWYFSDDLRVWYLDGFGREKLYDALHDSALEKNDFNVEEAGNVSPGVNMNLNRGAYANAYYI